MRPQEIVDTLSCNNGKFPRDAMLAAIADRDAIIPILLDELERLASDPQAVMAEDEAYMRHIFAMYLLAQFRETRAFAPLIKICQFPYEDLDFLLGDVITEGLPRILASVCGGDIAPIKSIIENQDLDEFVRSAGLSALVTLVAEGALQRDEAIAYLRALHRALTPESPMWNQWVYAADVLYPEDLLPELRAAFDADLVDPMWISMKDIERSLRQGRDHVLAMLSQWHRYIDDAIADLEHWVCFRDEIEEKETERYVRVEPGFLPYEVTLPVFRATPKIGRNDPCPCGSGKKYKKCCISA